MNPWQAALNPAIYSAAAVPVLVGTAAAFQQTGTFHPLFFVLALVGLILIQAWINLTNDVFDAETGVDKNKPWSLVNLTGQPQRIFWLGNLCLGLGAFAFGLLAWLQQDWAIVAASTVGCLLGYAYQGPPLRLSYRGVGEIISFLCFGPIAVTVSAYAQTQQWLGSALAASLIVGTLTSLILYTHHFAQIADDREAGKRSPIVRWGTKLAARRMIWLFVALYGWVVLFVVTGVLPWPTLLVLGTVVLSRPLFSWVNQFHDQPQKVGMAMPMVIQVHFLGGILLAAGLVMDRFL
ncbi:2-carboxy-1,4-naphthoquinone phytyltransferase [Anthocerotibacter panamensis]|uniref:2-carboxy-1,4-naphthoquinone phytyltransferase n=1 Tax=Anthocerotibacter panamensis TaxID=2857077 RepID=UPI001C401DDE|nr:2-carboxy-1,4-naphthoquinone phytyltransferase [Anthocerotibacter panamensis]